ncbi:MAG: protein kinase, partial [Phycisphaerales bacterium]|nr:protein kinase [Phycisphaerales bacterium]
MNESREEAVSRVYQMVRAASPADRDALLTRECAGDDALRAEVESLLGHDLDTASIIDHLAQSGAASDSNIGTEPPDNRDPERIGHYKILRRLGRGGMGTVYAALRDDAVRMMVAIKVVRKGIDTEDVLRRFERERQLVASLDHPNIAKFYDAGETEEGSPYFAMEYV